METTKIDEIFDEIHRRIEINPNISNIGHIQIDCLKLYSYKPYSKELKNSLFEYISHLNPKNIEEKLQYFVKKDKVIVKGKDIYYPSLEILLENDISSEEFYNKTKSFLNHSDHELHFYNPVHLIIKFFCTIIKSKREKYGYKTEFFFSSKNGSKVMGSVYEKEGKKYINLTSQSLELLNEYSKMVLKSLP